GRLNRPELSSGFPIDATSLNLPRSQTLFGNAVARVGCAHVDPLLEIDDHGFGEFLFLRRHLQLGIDVANRLDEQTVFRLTGHDRRAADTSLENARLAVESQFGVMCRFAMA